MAEKMETKTQAGFRSTFYDIISDALANAGYETEAVTGGRLVHIGDDQFAMVKVSIKNAEKFSLQEAREEYAEKQRAAAEKASKAAEKAAERERKAAEKAAAAAEKAEG